MASSSPDDATALVEDWNSVNESSLGGRNNETGSSPDWDSSFGQTSVIYRIQLYVVPFLVVFGVVGNGLSLWIFCTPAFRGHSSSCYLAALSASDTLFLLALLIVWASNAVLDLYNNQGWCQGVTYLTHVATFVSVWLVVAFTVERFIAVCYPLLRSAVCTVRRARAVVSGLFTLALLLYSYLLLAAGLEPMPPAGVPRCTLREGYVGVASIMNTLDTILTLVLPVIAVLTLNARIAKCVYDIDNFHREGAQFCPAADPPPPTRRFASHRCGGREEEEGGVLCGTNSATSKARKSQHGVTKMLLVISTIFIILNMPAYIMRLYMYFTDLAGNEKNGASPSVMMYTLQQTFTLLFYANFAVNFLLYCVTGQNFRRAVATLCRKRSSLPRIPTGNRGASSTFSRHRHNVSSMSPEASSSRRFRRLSHISRQTTTASVLLTDYCEGGVGTSSSNTPRKSPSVTPAVTCFIQDSAPVSDQRPDDDSPKAAQEFLTKEKSLKKLLEPLEIEE